MRLAWDAPGNAGPTAGGSRYTCVYCDFGDLMFENLTDKLQRAFKTLRGQGTLTEENISEALGEIRVALLEADVNLNVAKDLIEQIRVKAVGTEVLTSLSPS